MKKVTITYNSDEEMMNIKADGETIFHGNYWDFNRDPQSLVEFLADVGIEATASNNLPSIG